MFPPLKNKSTTTRHFLSMISMVPANFLLNYSYPTLLFERGSNTHSEIQKPSYFYFIYFHFLAEVLVSEALLFDHFWMTGWLIISNKRMASKPFLKDCQRVYGLVIRMCAIDLVTIMKFSTWKKFELQPCVQLAVFSIVHEICMNKKNVCA